MTETERLYARLLEIKSFLTAVFGRYEAWILPLLRFLTALVTILVINRTLPYMDRLSKVPLVLLVSLVCSLLPMAFTLLVAGAFILLNVYELSMEAALVTLALLLVMYLLYFRFTPKDAVLVLLTPLAFMFHIPCVMPLIAGLLGSAASFLSVACGIVLYVFLGYIRTNAAFLGSSASDDMLAKVRYCLDGLLNNKEMLVFIAAFTLTMLLVFFIRHLPLDYSWTIAIIAGAIADVVVLLIGDLFYETQMNIPGTLISSVFCVLIAFVVQFFAFNLDYRRAENVQFEDDEYYYYVRALPKVNVPLRNIQVKKIHTPMKREIDEEETLPAYKRTRKSNSPGILKRGSSQGIPQGAGELRSPSAAKEARSALNELRGMNDRRER